MISKPISKQQIKEYLDNPVSRRLIDILDDSKKNSIDSMVNIILATPDEKIMTNETLGKLLGYKAQIQTIELISNLEEFLSETLEEEIDEEIYPDRGQSNS